MLSPLTVVFVGHHQSGKTTLYRSLITALAKTKWDTPTEPTTECQVYSFSTKEIRYNFIDCPGLSAYTDHTIKGATTGDIAVLVVSALDKEFEESFLKTGQFKEHALLSFTVGIKKIIIAITKVDQLKDKKIDRIKEIEDEVSRWIQRCGFAKPNTFILPVSGVTGEGIHNSIPHSENFKTLFNASAAVTSNNTTSSLFDAFDKFVKSSIRRPIAHSLRLPIFKTVTSSDSSSPMYTGRIETGEIKDGQQIRIVPIPEIKEGYYEGKIKLNKDFLSYTTPGHITQFQFEPPCLFIKSGTVVCGTELEEGKKSIKSFVAQVIALLLENRTLTIGSQFLVHCHTGIVEAEILRFEGLLDKRTGKVLEENPKEMKDGQAAIMRIKPLTPFYIESFANFPPLGRFAIRDHPEYKVEELVLKLLDVHLVPVLVDIVVGYLSASPITIAVGVVKSVEY